MLSPGEYGSALCSEGSCDRPFLLQRRAGVAAERALPPSLMLLQEEFKKAASYSGAQGQLVHSVPHGAPPMRARAPHTAGLGMRIGMRRCAETLSAKFAHRLDEP